MQRSIRHVITNGELHRRQHTPRLKLRRRLDKRTLLRPEFSRGVFDGLTPEDWQAFERTIVQPSMNSIGRRQGAYAVAARKRRAEEKRR